MSLALLGLHAPLSTATDGFLRDQQTILVAYKARVQQLCRAVSSATPLPSQSHCARALDKLRYVYSACVHACGICCVVLSVVLRVVLRCAALWR